MSARDDSRAEGFSETLAAAKTGDESAWREIYEDLAPGVTGYARAQGSSEPDDLAGEVFVQVVRNVARFAGDYGQFRSWVFVIAHNRVLDERRKRRRRPVEAAGLEPRSGAPVEHADDDAAERAATEQVRRILDGLPGRQRDVLLLRILGDMTPAEVAETLGLRFGAVYALQRRAVARIRKQLAREADNFPGVQRLLKWDEPDETQ